MKGKIFIFNFPENPILHCSQYRVSESFNAKIKAFRSQFRGVKDVSFFLFRLTKLFA